MPDVLEELKKLVGGKDLVKCIKCSELASELESNVDDIFDALARADISEARRIFEHYLKRTCDELIKLGCIDKDIIVDFVKDLGDRIDIIDAFLGKTDVSKEDWPIFWDMDIRSSIAEPMYHRLSQLHALIILKSCGGR